MNAPKNRSTRLRSSRKGVAALSAITLALSGLSITSFNTVVPDAAHEYMRGSVREAVADVSGAGTVTLTVRDTNDSARLNVTRTEQVTNGGAVRLPFGVPNATTNLTIEAVVNGPTITGIRAHAI
ncbi:hypothetical protein [Corynebacterium aurimucosum]